MTSIYVTPFITSVINVINTICSVEPTAGTPIIKSGSETQGAVTGVIGLAGPQCTGNLMLSFDEPCALFLVSKLLMEDYQSLSKDVVDAIGEITNIITGTSKSELSEIGLEIGMATPMVFTGEGISIKQNSHTPMIAVSFQIPAGQFILQTNLAKR